MTFEEDVTKGMELLKNIEVFLREKRPSVNAGYSVPTREDIEQLYSIIHQLIELKFEDDPDGDYPIEIKLVDRTKGRMPYFSEVPYENRDLTGAFEGHIKNLRNAVEEVDKIFKHADDMKRYIEKIEQRYKNAR